MVMVLIGDVYVLLVKIIKIIVEQDVYPIFKTIMKKYKLIKEYPNSPRLHTEIINRVSTLPNHYYKIDDTTLGIEVVFSPQLFPDYFEEIVEKDYEILSFKNIQSNVLILLHENGKYCCKESTKYDGTGVNTVNHCLNSKYLKIHSIKRLSDSEIFNIDDDFINNFNSISKIDNFKIVANTIDIQYYCRDIYSCTLKDAKKVKQPLFTTVDSVDIFKGDIYYELITPEFHNKTCVWNILPNKTRSNINYDQEGNKKNGRLWFSTKEKAEEYIKFNKPEYSLNDFITVTKKVTHYPTETVVNNIISELTKLKK